MIKKYREFLKKKGLKDDRAKMAWELLRDFTEKEEKTFSEYMEYLEECKKSENFIYRAKANMNFDFLEKFKKEFNI